MREDAANFHPQPAVSQLRAKYGPRRNIIPGQMDQSLDMPDGVERAEISLSGTQSTTGMTNFGIQEHTVGDGDAR